jgi:hypothetical protein
MQSDPPTFALSDLKGGKTPVLSWMRERKCSIQLKLTLGLRDARIQTTVYCFARVGAVVAMKAGNYFRHMRK